MEATTGQTGCYMRSSSSSSSGVMTPSRQHTGGNPRPYLELWSHADDVSLMGGVGGYQVGIDEVSV